MSSTYSTQTLNKNITPDKRVRPLIPLKTHLSNLLDRTKIHAVSLDYEYNSTSKNLVLERMQCRHGLVAAILQAYNGHQHLLLSPDDIWLTISQGISQHIYFSTDKCKDRFYKKKRITIFNESILSVDPETKCLVGDWPECIRQFITSTDKQIKKLELQSLLNCNFSTSTQSSIISSRVVLLNSASNYYPYNIHVFCGIPKVTLTGTLNDWLCIQEKLVQLRKFSLGLNPWFDLLDPIISKFIETYRGEVDEEFWKGIAREDYGCGGPPELTGWVTAFFPYDSFGNVIDDWLDEAKLPEGRVYIPFDVESGQKMKFVSGFLGVNQRVIENSDGEVVVSPLIGWAVIDESKVSFDARKQYRHILW
ncbi:9272_t:CDS:1 [Diversispora eburnea]|uniref:9272_t:CDS:1 n=1 Tax=Diversispora eburnea TaxID=1213867 RepID=A0A9N8VC21_9GLOM|nr:9272_t:CDS:1 [Diversispora eburnea]